MKKNFTRKGIDYYILLFFSTSFIGWIWEVLLYLFMTGQFINRGVYHGPYLPIYGFGCVGMYALLRRYRRKWLHSFVLAALLCTILEYISSCYLEWIWGFRWWDYSEYFGNVNGRICLAASLGFGIAGMVFNCYFLRKWNATYIKSSGKWRRRLSYILVLIFCIDVVYCGMYPHVGYGIGVEAGMIR